MIDVRHQINFLGEMYMGNPVLTVIIASYNFGSYLVDAVDSVLAQNTQFPFQIIILDDCSNEKSQEYLEKCRLKSPSIISVVQPEHNCGYARELMFRMRPEVNTKYIAYLDGDDFWYSDNKIETQVSFLESNKDFVASCHKTLIYKGKNRKDHGLYGGYKIGEGYIKEWDIRHVIAHKHKLYHHVSSYIFRNIFIQKDGFFLPDIMRYPIFLGDVNLAMLYLRQGGKVRFFNELLSIYRYTEKGIWSKEDERLQLEILLLQKLSMDLITKKNYHDTFIREYETLLKEYKEIYGEDLSHINYNVKLDDIKDFKLMRGIRQIF